jgi:hypothetical protein
MIGDSSTSEALGRLTADPDAAIRVAAIDARRRVDAAAEGRRA